MAKPKTITFQLKCTKCGELNYNTSKNPTENKDKVVLKKHCQKCRVHTEHKEVKISKAKK